MWYSDKFWSDVTNTELRARWNAKLAREGCKNLDPICDDDLESDNSCNQRYRIPVKPRSNIHYLSGTLQAGYATPDSFKEYQRSRLQQQRGGSRSSGASSVVGGSQAGSRAGSETSSQCGGSVCDLMEVTDGSYLFAPSCGYFRIGQLNPMNNNSAQFSCCNQHKGGMKRYEGYDWRFPNRVKNVNSFKKTVSDAQLLTQVAECKAEWHNNGKS